MPASLKCDVREEIMDSWITRAVSNLASPHEPLPRRSKITFPVISLTLTSGIYSELVAKFTSDNMHGQQSTHWSVLTRER